jgi:hypothetical protein
MTDPSVTWRDRYPDQVTCIRCLEVKDLMDVDRLLWCDDCRRKARNRAVGWGWIGGLVCGAGMAAYIWGIIRPSDMVLGGWMATVVATIWLGAKVCRELVYGGMRFLNTRAVEAVPPEPPPQG